MRFGEKVTLYIFRPIYRTFIERLLWWFLARVKVFLLAEIGPQISECLAKIDDIERHLRENRSPAWTAVEERLRAVESSNAVKWDALEQLLLAVLRQPESRTLDTNWSAGVAEESTVSSASELNRVHAAGNLR